MGRTGRGAVGGGPRGACTGRRDTSACRAVARKAGGASQGRLTRPAVAVVASPQVRGAPGSRPRGFAARGGVSGGRSRSVTGVTRVTAVVIGASGTRPTRDMFQMA